MGIFEKIKDLRARSAMQTARKRIEAGEVGTKEWQAARRTEIVTKHIQDKREREQATQEVRIERETQKLEKELPLLQRRAEATKLRAEISVARERARAGPHADIRGRGGPAPLRDFGGIHSGFFGGGRRRAHVRTREQPPIALPGFGVNLGVGQAQPAGEKKKQRYGAFGEPL